MESYVNIVIADRGWILEKLASEITMRLPYTRYGDVADSRALINYYINYHAFKRKTSPIELAWFTHIEADPISRDLFFNTARQMSWCLCHSPLYAQELREAGIQNVSTLKPGVDLERFRPKLQIGVVGRTYKTGRKGHTLVGNLQDIDWIDWHFTGQGWPGRALELPEEEMPAFYRRMDYILVASLYEGGPMCVPEAIACGTKVIAPPIGWVEEFPHIEYRTGDEADLRRVLVELYNEKKSHAEKVANVTWESWAEGHDKLFKRLAMEVGGRLSTKNFPVVSRNVEVALISQGNEKAAKGGPSVRVPKLAHCLSQWSKYRPRLVELGDPFPEHTNLVHTFNTVKNTSETALKSAYIRGIPTVLSPIFLDPRYIGLCMGVKQLCKEYYSEQDFLCRFRSLVEINGPGKLPALKPGEFERIQAMFDMSTRLICLSECEEKTIKAYGFNVPSVSRVHNPVESTLFSDADPNLFRSRFGLTDYVLCVGRIDFRKNQHLLAWVLRDLDIPVVFAGHQTNPDDLELLRLMGGKNLFFAGRLEPNSPLLASAYAGARVYCLPSWAEGASLANLEAAASGCNMVVSSWSSESEYFGEFARYCDPASLDSLRDTVIAAWDNPINPDTRSALREHVRKNFSWEKHTADTLAAYEEALETPASVPQRSSGISALYIDVTWTAYHPFMSGFTRAEVEISKILAQIEGQKVKFVFFDENKGTFVEINGEKFLKNPLGEVWKHCAQNNGHNWCPGAVFEPNSAMLIIGSHWLLRNDYTQALCQASREASLDLYPVVADIISLKIPRFSVPRDAAVADNLRDLLEVCTTVFTPSHNTEKDIAEYFASKFLPLPCIKVVPWATELPELENPLQLDLTHVMSIIGSRKFVLCVSSLDKRKNHQLLLEVWERLVEDLGVENTPHLLCVGYPGRYGEQIIAERNNRPSIRARVQFLCNLSDGEVDWLYRNSLFTVFPTFYEGWGLPAGESLARGKVCIASNASSVSEIAPEFTDLLDPLDFRSWYESIKAYIINPQLRIARERIVANYVPTTWRDLSLRIYERIVRNGNSSHMWETIPFGRDPISFDKRESLRLLGNGWRAKDKKLEAMDGASLLFGIRRNVLPTLLEFESECTRDDLTLQLAVNGQRIVEVKPSTLNGAPWHILLPAQNGAGTLQQIRLNFHASPAIKDANPLFTLKSIRVDNADLEDIRVSNALAWLGEKNADLAYVAASVLIRRSDLRALLPQKEDEIPVSLLLWILGFSKREEPMLHKHMPAVQGCLHELYEEPASHAKVQGYSLLIDALWHLRPDLQFMDIKTNSGQEEMVTWFHFNGIEEYGLQAALQPTI